MGEIAIYNETSPLKELPKKKEPSSKTRRLIFSIIKGILLVIFAVALGASSQISYQYLRYQKFFVNGESMYPTLNAYTVEKDANGNIVSGTKTYNRRDFATPTHSYSCDYGIMDTSKETINKLSRFDIVVTYYDSEIGSDGLPLESASLKIKRVIGLPNEKIYFDNNGDLYVNDSLYEQPFLEPQSWWNEEMLEWAKTAKKETAVGVNYSSYTLGEEQYFLVGDNRLKGASRDSREIGPVSFSSIVGQAIAVTASCWYTISSNGEGKETLDWTTLRMPWNLIQL